MILKMYFLFSLYFDSEIQDNYYNEFGIYPLKDGVNLDLSASAYVRFLGKKLETETFYKRIEIIPAN